jgi:pimeloyl-ACP methyl ester carboxylesterase
MMTAAVRRNSVRLSCPDGLPIGLDLFVPEGTPRKPPVTVVCHGFKGFKDWGFFAPLAERLATGGRAVAVFDFSHNGVGERPGEFDRLDLFGRQTMSRHVQDLGTVLDALDGEFGRAAGLPCERKASIVGHSLGGAVAILRASEDGRVVSVATINGCSHLNRVPAEEAERAKREGKILVHNARTGQDMPLERGWFDDIARHDLETAATQVFVPALVLQGARDESVTPDEGAALAGWIAGSRLVTVPDADHVFGARHPFAGWTPALERVARELDAFLPSVERTGGL